jgi:hypothetical protein
MDRPGQAAQATERPAPAPAVEFPRPEPASERSPAERSFIGDEIRIPILWCEFGRCIERYTHGDALGERDLRALALADGWRYDALGRLACPCCVQSDSSFWASRLPVPLRRDGSRVSF